MEGLSILGGIILVGAGAAAWRWYKGLDSTRLNEASSDWGNDIAARGLTPKQAQEELALRLSLAAVRRRASDRVLAEPAKAIAIVREEIEEECKQLGFRDRKFSYLFKKASLGWDFSDILYPDAYDAWMASPEPIEPYSLTADQKADMIAAMRMPR